MTDRHDAAAEDLGGATHLDALLAACGPVEGRRVVDIGCGEGGLARALAERGAEVTGIDPFIDGADWTEIGQGRFRLLRTGGEALPFPDSSIDLVLFVFSLHHLPGPAQSAALAETRRVLRDGGLLYVAEPLAEGPFHEAVSSFHDETDVRADAAARLAAETPALFTAHRRLSYSESRRYAGFDGFAARMIANTRFNGYRPEDVLAPAVRRRFQTLLARTGGVFDQPVRIDLYGARRTG
jgi:ubiquinone/menaquinone biosynthesis C-methylase UbiE